MFDRILKPCYARLNQAFRQANPQIVLVSHSDGAVSRLLPTFREVGYEVFNPVQPGVPGHGPQDLKDAFGDQFIFWAAIDQQDLLPRGSDADLEADIRQKIRILGKDRGYIIPPAHILQADVSPKDGWNGSVELCRKHGRYLRSELERVHPFQYVAQPRAAVLRFSACFLAKGESRDASCFCDES